MRTPYPTTLAWPSRFFKEGSLKLWCAHMAELWHPIPTWYPVQIAPAPHLLCHWLHVQADGTSEQMTFTAKSEPVCGGKQKQ